MTSLQKKKLVSLIEMIKQLVKKNNLQQSVLNKIYLKSEVSHQVNSFSKAHLSKLVEKIKLWNCKP